MNKRGPKPKSGQNATEQVSVKLTPSQLEQVKQQAAESGFKTAGEFARDAVLKAVPSPSPEDTNEKSQK